jgi:hypothetical protein
LLQFVLLLGWVSLAFRRPFFSLAIGLRIFLSLSAAAVSSAELFLVLYLWSRHHHRRSHVLLFSRLFLNVRCFLSSCFHQSFKFCSPFLICDVW